MALLVPAVSWVVAQAGTFAESGETIPFGWKLAIAVTNWYVRLLPFIAIGGVGFAALVGGFRSRGCPIVQERRALLAWVVLAAVYMAVPVVASAFPPIDHISANWIHGLTPVMGVEVVAPAAAVLIGAHLQGRIRASLSSRVRGWHIAVGSVVLAILGPALLIPPMWVWHRTRALATVLPR
jgi:hypothetical protein